MVSPKADVKETMQKCCISSSSIDVRRQRRSKLGYSGHSRGLIDDDLPSMTAHSDSTSYSPFDLSIDLTTEQHDFTMISEHMNGSQCSPNTGTSSVTNESIYSSVYSKPTLHSGSRCTTPSTFVSEGINQESPSEFDRSDVYDRSDVISPLPFERLSHSCRNTESSDVTVAIRFKPLPCNSTNAWNVNKQSDGMCVLEQTSTGTSNRITHKFAFDRIFEEGAQTRQIFEDLAQPLIASVVNNRSYNGSLFAHGATGSGKTFTMQGTSLNPGLIPLAAERVFSLIHLSDIQCEVNIQYIEVYNEQVRDLLDDNKNLVVMEDVYGKVVHGGRTCSVLSSDDILQCMRIGNRNRACAATNLNSRSSRSHAIFSIIIRRQDENVSSENEECTRNADSVLSLVDLAGSENTSLAMAGGVRKQEGGSINKSLLTLSQVIHVLSLPVNKRPKHIPYRSSKLTRLMKSQLSGNSKIAILSCISRALTCVDETKSSLKFATTAKKIAIIPTNSTPSSPNMSTLAALQDELAKTKDALRQLQQRMASNVFDGLESEDGIDVSSELVIGDENSVDDIIMKTNSSPTKNDQYPPVSVVVVKNIKSVSETVVDKSLLEEAEIRAKFLEEQLQASDSMAAALLQSLRDFKTHQCEASRFCVDVSSVDDIKFILDQGKMLRSLFVVSWIFLWNGQVTPFCGIIIFLWTNVEMSSY